MTRQILFSLVIILTSTQAFSQTYSYEQIVGTADSIVKANLDPKLLKYFSRDSGDIKYEFKRNKWRKYKTRYARINKGEITKGNFNRTHMFYGFHYKEPLINDPLVPGFLPGDIFLVFDSKLNQTEQVDLSFIPKYVREQRPCDFITMDKAIELSKLDKIQNGLEPLTATLSYNGNLKNYCWCVTSVLKKEPYRNSTRGEADTVTIDALTGQILSHEMTYFGPMH
jgi:hypothetical protein